LKFTIDGLERERDFYFGKLRDVEVMCQGFQAEPASAPEKDAVIQKVLDILYEYPKPKQQFKIFFIIITQICF